MNPEAPVAMGVVVIIYIFAALFVLLWAYLTTKLTFSLVSKKRYVLRTAVWFVTAWPLALVLYFVFMLGGGVVGLAIETVMNISG